jgi:putative ABC transport system permease protein
MMGRVLLLAWRYVAYHKVKTLILILGLTLTIVLPLAAHLLIAHFGSAWMARARATPLVVGARGNRFDLVLKTLYFGSAHVDTTHLSEVETIRAGALGEPIPLHLRYTARGYPIVGTTLGYFEFRGLRVARGTLPLRLGQAVLGATVAAELQLGPGDSLFSDQQSLYDIASTYPLKMHIAGVLEKSDTPDDQAVFIDLKTAWIIDGITHGHQDVAAATDDSVILQRTEENVVTNAAIVEYNEVTPENIDSFHTHAEPDELPLSTIIVRPRDPKSATLLKARYNVSETHRMLVPAEVVEELLGLVFRVKRFFDANFALIAVSTGLFIALVVLLSQRIRQREMETMFKIGCSRMTTFWLQAAELAIVLLISVVLAGVLSIGALLAAPYFLPGL